MAQIKNLIFEGGGVLGIAYLGALEYLSQKGILKGIKRVGGTSAGAITACITSLNLPFPEIKEIADSLDYKRIPAKSDLEKLELFPTELTKTIEDLFGDVSCLYRLIHNYGWYSTDYFYRWLQEMIANEFDEEKKLPPYTFADFQNKDIHKNSKSFLELYMIGTNLSKNCPVVFSYETTPDMEVAMAVRISMSVPLFFEGVELETEENGEKITNVFCDGGMVINYPIRLFDDPKFNEHLFYGVNRETLGICFKQKKKQVEIHNLLDYIESLLRISSVIQEECYEEDPLNKSRSIFIDVNGVSALDFNLETGDDTYRFLYQQGYVAAKEFYEKQV
jgi:NTE family protein